MKWHWVFLILAAASAGAGGYLIERVAFMPDKGPGFAIAGAILCLTGAVLLIGGFGIAVLEGIGEGMRGRE